MTARNFRKVSEEEQAKQIEENIRKYSKECKLLKKKIMVKKIRESSFDLSSKFKSLRDSVRASTKNS